MSDYDDDDGEYYDDDDGELVTFGALLPALDRRAASIADDIAHAVVPEGAPPNALSAERALLGGILLEPSSLDLAIDEGLRPEDFYKRPHGRVYAAMLHLSGAGEPVDTVTVCERLRATGELEGVGGASAVSQMESLIPTAAHVGAYARHIREAAVRRRLIEVGTGIVRDAHRGAKLVPALVDEAERAVMAVGVGGSRKHSHEMDALIRSSLEGLERAYKAKLSVTGLASGLDEVDALTSGFQNGELIIVAARPSMGKTAICLQAATHAALRLGVHVAFFSLEMGAQSLGERLIANEARIDLAKMKKGYVPSEKWVGLARATGELGEAPIHIEDPPSLTLAETRSTCRRLHNEHGLGLIIVDYLQLMTGLKSERKDIEVGELSKGLKSLARELDVPVIALSQLSRGVESRTDKKPMMSDLRESGAIEQDADVIMFLYREDYYLKEKCPDDTKGTAEVIVAKHRNGPTGTAKVLFDGPTTRFDNKPKPVEGYAP